MSKYSAKILVVDDLPDWRSTMSGLLRDEMYDVQTADSQSQAIALLEAASFDLAVLDMRLDESNEDNTEGLELAEIIQYRWPLVKIILLTGYSTPERMTRAMAQNAKGKPLVDEFIEKDESEKIIETVKALLKEESFS